MSAIILLLFQLWNQPSVRMLGFGKDFAGFIPDPITDLSRNPAYLKTFGEGTNSHNTPQVYSMMRAFSTTALAEQIPDIEFYENEELGSIYALYPKIGFACRLGAWQRMDLGTYYDYRRLWPYGQTGFLGSLDIGKWITIGTEYNCSWNTRPDSFRLGVGDSLGQLQPVHITKLVWSNEIGFGMILTGKKIWQLSISGKKNWETRNLTSDIPFPFGRGPEGELTAYKAHYDDFQFNTRLRYMPNRFIYSATISYFRKRIERDGVNHTMDYYFESARPGIGIVFYPRNDLFIVTSMAYALNKINYAAYPGTSTIAQKVIGLIGFESVLSRVLKFRFGSTLTYMYLYQSDHQFKNELSFGIDITPHEKLTFNFATINPLEYSFWYFGLSFAL